MPFSCRGRSSPRGRGALREKNGKPPSRLLLATVNSREGYGSVSAQLVLAYVSVETSDFGDSRGAMTALEAEYRLKGESRIQQLHDHLASLEVIAPDKYNPPAKVIQELRHTLFVLRALGDVGIPPCEAHTRFGALPDEEYQSLKTAMLVTAKGDACVSMFGSP